MNGDSFTPDRLRRAKNAYTTRRIRLDAMARLLTPPAVPRAGDVVLARVDVVGQHYRIERPGGRKAKLLADDEVVVC